MDGLDAGKDYKFAFTDTFNDDATDDAEYDIPALIPGTYRLEFDAYDEIPQGLSEAAHEFWNDQPSFELAQTSWSPARARCWRGTMPRRYAASTRTRSNTSPHPRSAARPWSARP